MIIQKYIRRYLVKKKYKNNLVSIIDFIQYNKRIKEYHKNLKIMKMKKKAILVIENWWERILEERKRRELEEQIRKCLRIVKNYIDNLLDWESKQKL